MKKEIQNSKLKTKIQIRQFHGNYKHATCFFKLQKQNEKLVLTLSLPNNILPIQYELLFAFCKTNQIDINQIKNHIKKASNQITRKYGVNYYAKF